MDSDDEDLLGRPEPMQRQQQQQRQQQPGPSGAGGFGQFRYSGVSQAPQDGWQQQQAGGSGASLPHWQGGGDAGQPGAQRSVDVWGERAPPGSTVPSEWRPSGRRQ